MLKTNNIKKITAMLTVFFLVFSITACGGKKVAPEVGKYKAISVEEGGTKIEGETLESLGMDVTLELKEDGTGTMNFGGEEGPVEWKDGKIIDKSSGETTKIKYILKDNTITLSEDTMSIVLEKQKESK